MIRNLYIQLSALFLSSTFLLGEISAKEVILSNTVNNSIQNEKIQDRPVLLAFFNLKKSEKTKGKSEDEIVIHGELENIFQTAKDIINQDSVWNTITDKFKTIFRSDSDYTDKVYLGIIVDDKGGIAGTHPIVTSVLHNSPAALSDIQENDIIINIDSNEITNLEDIIEIISEKKCGDSIRIQIQRDNQLIDKTIRLSPLQRNYHWLSSVIQEKIEEKIDSCKSGMSKSFCKKIIMEKATPRLGVKVVDIDEVARRELKAKNGGVKIVGVLNHSVAEIVGLHNNDVITKINDNKVMNILDLKNYLSHSSIPLDFNLEYIRNGKKKKVKGVINEFNQVWDNNSLGINKIIE
ncbi:MAG: PDZ domain-containing protein [Chitinophagales bacterium]|nr:PDZ domain-containing protein [Chitinophagales bacterium]